MWPNDRVFFFFGVGSILNIYEYFQSMKKTRWHAEVKWGVIWVKLSPCMSWGKLNCFSCLFHAVETGISASNFWLSINLGPLVKELINLNGLSYIFIFGLENCFLLSWHLCNLLIKRKQVSCNFGQCLFPFQVICIQRVKKKRTKKNQNGWRLKGNISETFVTKTKMEKWTEYVSLCIITWMMIFVRKCKCTECSIFAILSLLGC